MKVLVVAVDDTAGLIRSILTDRTDHQDQPDRHDDDRNEAEREAKETSSEERRDRTRTGLSDDIIHKLVVPTFGDEGMPDSILPYFAGALIAHVAFYFLIYGHRYSYIRSTRIIAQTQFSRLIQGSPLDELHSQDNVDSSA